MEKFESVVRSAKYFLLDMDGTVYLGDELIGKMNETLDVLRNNGKKIIYLTNNSSKSRDKYVEKLSRLDLLREGDDIYTSGMAAADHLTANYPGKSVCLLGTEALKREFIARGVTLSDENADICVLAYDTELTYDKLCRFVGNLKRGATYIATHPDVNCPAEKFFVPDAGAFIQLIYASTGLKPSLIIGKPYTTMGVNLSLKYNAPPEQFIMVGDRLYTDIKFGIDCGFHTLLVLSGESTLKDVSALLDEDKPELITDSLNDVVKYL